MYRIEVAEPVRMAQEYAANQCRSHLTSWREVELIKDAFYYGYLAGRKYKQEPDRSLVKSLLEKLEAR